MLHYWYCSGWNFFNSYCHLPHLFYAYDFGSDKKRRKVLKQQTQQLILSLPDNYNLPVIFPGNR